MNGAELTLAFMAGLAGSGHCLGMCGGLVAALAVMTPETTNMQRLLATFAYHFGRIFTYSILGVIVGAASHGALITSHTAIFNWLFFIANLLVVVVGISTTVGINSMSISKLDGAGYGCMGKILGKVARSTSPLPFIGAGMLMGFLPCGLVYGVLLTTTGSGSWFNGGVRMLAFGLGTLPALMLYGQVANSIRSALGPYFLRLMGLLVALLGAFGIAESLVRMGFMKPI